MISPQKITRRIYLSTAALLIAGGTLTITFISKKNSTNTLQTPEITTEAPITTSINPEKQQAARAELQNRGIPTTNYNSYLLTAARQGDTELLQLLLTAGADVHHCDPEGYTPLHIAAGNGKAQAVQTLLRAGAAHDLTRRTTGGHTPLHEAAQTGKTTCIAPLLAAGADPRCTTSEGYTPLHLAAAATKGSPDCIPTLLSTAAAADLHSKDNTGRTPLHAAADSGNSANLHALLTAGAQINLQDDTGRTPLHAAAAAYWCNPECIQTLLNAGANPHTADHGGHTPLHLVAAHWGDNPTPVQLLLSAGATPGVTTIDELTPLQLAEKQGNTRCAELLRNSEQPNITPP